jgi:hypothetical protein
MKSLDADLEFFLAVDTGDMDMVRQTSTYKRMLAAVVSEGAFLPDFDRAVQMSLAEAKGKMPSDVRQTILSAIKRQAGSYSWIDYDVMSVVACVGDDKGDLTVGHTAETIRRCLRDEYPLADIARAVEKLFEGGLLSKNGDRYVSATHVIGRAMLIDGVRPFLCVVELIPDGTFLTMIPPDLCDGYNDIVTELVGHAIGVARANGAEPGKFGRITFNPNGLPNRTQLATAYIDVKEEGYVN